MEPGSEPTPDLLLALLGMLGQMAEDFNAGRFVPLMEADIDGYLASQFLAKRICTLPGLHQNARVAGVLKRRYDLALGRVDFSPEPGVRAAISDPKLVLQVKVFPRWGFTPQQHNVHLHHVLEDDIPSLGDLARRWPDSMRCLVLADFWRTDRLDGYLSGKIAGSRRIEAVVSSARTQGVQVIWVHPTSDEGMTVSLTGSLTG